LFNWLNRAFDDISANAFCGVQIPKKQIPKEYSKKYGIDNLWKYNLSNAWRLLYSVARDEIIVVAIILEWMPHKDYEKRFGY
jgi:mRNA-degrading endonuclease RelE of RelBE toxin-antitoxin system